MIWQLGTGRDEKQQHGFNDGERSLFFWPDIWGIGYRAVESRPCRSSFLLILNSGVFVHSDPYWLDLLWEGSQTWPSLRIPTKNRLNMIGQYLIGVCLQVEDAEHEPPYCM